MGESMPLEAEAAAVWPYVEGLGAADVPAERSSRPAFVRSKSLHMASLRGFRGWGTVYSLDVTVPTGPCLLVGASGGEFFVD